MPSTLPIDSATPVPSVIVLGTDAVLAARPATPVQLALACLRAGYQLAVPASWGDELVAAECARQLETRGREPAIHCACPHVASRLLATGDELAPFLVSLVAPPVATARYLRGLYGSFGVQITYVGDCPGADDEMIDARFTPEEFLAVLARRDIRVHEQPVVFDSVIPPDRRRFLSLPGGLPAPERLWELQRRAVVEIDGDDYSAELAQHLVASECVLVDLSPRLGCACSGAGAGTPPATARAAVMALEPPRASQSPVETATALELTHPLPGPLPTPAMGMAVVQAAWSPPGDSRGGGLGAGETRNSEARADQLRTLTPRPRPAEPLAPPPRRRPTPAGFFRAYTAPVPQTRTSEGPALPRAYVGRRRSLTPIRAIDAVTMDTPPAELPLATHERPRTELSPDAAAPTGDPAPITSPVDVTAIADRSTDSGTVGMPARMPASVGDLRFAPRIPATDADAPSNGARREPSTTPLPAMPLPMTRPTPRGSDAVVRPPRSTRHAPPPPPMPPPRHQYVAGWVIALLVALALGTVVFALAR